MPAARPSKTTIRAVLDAMREAGVEPGEVHVLPDGGFVVAVVGEVRQRHPINPADLVSING